MRLHEGRRAAGDSWHHPKMSPGAGPCARAARRALYSTHGTRAIAFAAKLQRWNDSPS